MYIDCTKWGSVNPMPSATLSNPQLSANATGAVTDDVRQVQLEARLANLALDVSICHCISLGLKLDSLFDTTRARLYVPGLGEVRDRAMRALGLAGVRRAKGIRTTIPAADGRRAGDLLNRDFTAEAPNQTWVMDFT